MKKTSLLVLSSTLIATAMVASGAARYYSPPPRPAPVSKVDPDPNFDTDATAVPGQYLVTFDDGLDDDAEYVPETTGTALGPGSSSNLAAGPSVPTDDNWVNPGEGITVPSAVTKANAIAATFGLTPAEVYDSVGVFLVGANETTARAMSHDARVRCVVSDTENLDPGSGNQVVPSPNGPDYDNWGLDRLDERDIAPSSKNRDHHYRYTKTGNGVNAYIIDSGIYTAHEQFQGRAHLAYSAVEGESPDDKYKHHGTQVASIVGGRSYGSAKGVQLYAVKAWGKNHGVKRTYLLRAFNWLRKNAQKPAVANSSLYLEKLPKWLDNLINYSGPVERAWRRMIGSGVMACACAGNKNKNTDRYLPSGTERGFTVAASDRNDYRATFSCYGPGVDIFGPGVEIETADWYKSTSNGPRIDGAAYVDGTSYASPYTAGVIAQYLEGKTPSQYTYMGTLQWLKDQASLNAIVNRPGATGSPTGSPSTANRLLFTNQ